ncbi:matrixin family metalloprotease [Fibrivirga algicola]|uniref:Matrixin family metalloprotease n=1 Tax=Fibrivirga algicola TaxID=2950420 RepID=A0ABX0QQE0_9BACT|nr:matrixin family metalloprotease [Fibrivirga algicola]NID13506.1 matrixin family metalloprotease [Fibrivirga algicola]
MAKKKESYSESEGRTLDATPIANDDKGKSFCAMPQRPARVFSPNIDPSREALILLLGNKWANATVLHYYFFDRESDGEFVFFQNGTKEFRTWTGEEAQKDVVRDAFKVWKSVGIGLEFTEVTTRGEAEIRIGFMQGDGAWSFLGRDILGKGPDERTMNFGWDLTRPGEIDTAIHEIGHTLGFPHEHQNPNSGIVWDEEAVINALAAPPNNWSREKTIYNIIRKIAPDTVRGSNWDPNSIMHYPFGPGLIKSPEEYRLKGLNPPGGLSDFDKVWVKQFYPQLNPANDQTLEPFKSVQLKLAPGDQQNFVIEPADTRYYTVQVFGTSDTVAALFEEVDGVFRFKTADDDSGQDRNATIRLKLFKGRRYKLRIRLYYTGSAENNAVMMW